MYCVDCGEEKKIFREGSCLSCFLKRHQFTKGPSIFNIPYCVHCHAYKYKHTWYEETFEDVLTRYIKQNYSISNELKKVKISIESDNAEDVEHCMITISGILDDETISESHPISVRIKKNVCDLCSKQFGGYHEAIVQIRPEKRKLSNEKLSEIQYFVDDAIIMMQEQGNRKLFLSDYGLEHGGLDFFLSDKQAAYAITKKVQEKFGGTITVSSKNVGMKDGKQLYRYTYLLRLSPFEIFDVIRFKDEYFIIGKLHRNNVHIIDLFTGVESIHDASYLEGAMIIGNKDLLKEMIVVSQTTDELQVMDKDSYAVRTVKNPNNLSIEDETVEVVYIDEDHVFLNPLLNQKG